MINLKSVWERVLSRLAPEKLKTILRDTGKYRGGKVLWAVFRTLLLIGISYILLYPILYMVSNAFKPVIQNYDPSVIWLPKSFTLKNITDAIFVLEFWTTLKHTLLANVFSSVLQVLSCMVVGYGFARFKFKGRSLLFGLVLLTMIVPPQTISTSLYFEYRFFDIFGVFKAIGRLFGKQGTINLVGSYWAFYIPALLGMGLRSGLYIFVFRQFFRGMPKELEDSANIDGCGPYSAFLRIMAPNAVAAIVTVSLFALVWQWNDFYTPAIYMSNKYTIATALAAFQNNLTKIAEVGGTYTDPFIVSTRIQAACLLSIAPLLTMYIFLQRYFTESIERTGINS